MMLRPFHTSQRAREVLQEEGLLGLLLYGLRRSCRPVIEIDHFLFFETDLTQPLPPLPAARVPLEVHPLCVEEVATFAPTFQAAGLAPQEVRRRLARGDVCMIALSGSQLVHFQWVAFSPVRIGGKGEGLSLILHLGTGEAYSYDAVTLAAWRGWGIHPVVSEYLHRYEQVRGYTRHILYVNARNRASLKTVARLGRTRTKTVWSLRLLEGRWHVLFGATRHASPSLTPEASPLPSRLHPSLADPRRVPGIWRRAVSLLATFLSSFGDWLQ